MYNSFYHLKCAASAVGDPKHIFEFNWDTGIYIRDHTIILVNSVDVRGASAQGWQSRVYLDLEFI